MKLVFSSILICYWEAGCGSWVDAHNYLESGYTLTIFVSPQRLLMCPYKVWHALIKRLSMPLLTGNLIIKFLAKIFFLKRTPHFDGSSQSTSISVIISINKKINCFCKESCTRKKTFNWLNNAKPSWHCTKNIIIVHHFG